MKRKRATPEPAPVPEPVPAPKRRGVVPGRWDAIPRTKQVFYGTKEELAIVKVFVARMRAREVELSILGIMRRAGVEIDLDETREGLIVSGANAAQVEQIRSNKAAIVTALKGEALAGKGYVHSALAAGITLTWTQIRGNQDYGVLPETCQEALNLLEGFVERIDALAYLSLDDATADYLKSIHPRLEELVARINVERAAMLEGKELFEAIKTVFNGKIDSKKTFNPEAFR